MQRYFIPPEQLDLARLEAVIGGDDVRHVVKVMRYGLGDKVICSNGEGLDVEAVVTLVQQDKVFCRIMRQLESREPSIEVTLAQALLKGEKMDWVIQKATEIGASRVVAFTSSRTIVQLDHKKEEKRRERWGKIAKEAAEQSQRSHIPLIADLLSWPSLLASREGYDLGLIAYEKEVDSLFASLQQLMASRQGDARPSVLLVVGPEGGFSADEVKQAMAAGFASVSLGRRPLRAETAGLVGLSAIFYHAEQVGR